MVLLDEACKNVTVKSNLKPNDYVLINPACVGYYKVNYSDEMLYKLNVPLEYLTFPMIDRIGLLSDLYSLAVSGKKNIKQVAQKIYNEIIITNYCLLYIIINNRNKLTINN